jgi:hypothetical protein
LHFSAKKYNNFPDGMNEPYIDGLNPNEVSGKFVNDSTNPFGPNWAVLLLPYIEQQNLFNASNVLGYPGIPGPYSPGPPYSSIPNAFAAWAGFAERGGQVRWLGRNHT